MADTKITALNGGTKHTAAALALVDVFPIVDVSDTAGPAGAASGTAKPLDLQALLEGQRRLLSNHSTTAQGAGFSSDTYLTGSNVAIPAGYPVVGTTYKLTLSVTKTAAGTATPTLTVRVGTAGSTADSSRCAFTWGAGTAAADTGIVDVLCTFRTVGSGTSAVLQGMANIRNVLASTGLTNVTKTVVTTGGGFDSTVSSLIIGASWNGGASASHTVQLVRAELIL